jgi:isoleucyl-tRNA synthetase
MFQPVDANVSFPEIERLILEFWRKADIYNKSLQKRAQGPSICVL